MKFQVLAACALVLVSFACGGGGSSGGGSSIGTPQATVALGDVGASDLSELSITFHSLGVAGNGVTSYLVEEGVDAPVSVNALDYQGGAAPIAKKPIAAGTYDTLFFKLTITARDNSSVDVPVHPIFDPQGDLYTEVETVFPLGSLNEFTVAEPAEDNQPFLFLHVDVQNSVQEGEIDGTITVAPRIFLSTALKMALHATVTQIDAGNGVFEVEDTQGTRYVVQPTTCTTIVTGFDEGQSGVGADAVFQNVAVGASLTMEGTLGVDQGCDDPGQKAVFYHPHFVKTTFDTTGIRVVNGIVKQVVALGESVSVQVLITHVQEPGGSAFAPPVGDTFVGDFATTQIFSGRGEVQDLTGNAERLQVGEVVGIGVQEFASGPSDTWIGTPLVAFVQDSRVCGMIEAVSTTALTVSGTSAKKGAGTPWNGCSFSPLSTQQNPLQVEFGADTTFHVAAATDVRVGPRSGWRLTQVCDPYYDNQLAGPGASDGQSLPQSPCGDETLADVDIDLGSLTAFVDHKSNGTNEWTIQRLQLELSSDATQKYVAWFDGQPACTQPSNGAWHGNPCIETVQRHRQRMISGSPLEVGWANFAQSGAGRFGTSILNAGSRVPGSTTPTGSDTAGWDDVNERVLLGIDFDADMYPFDDEADSCVGLSERVWVDISQAQFFYFNRDSVTGAIDMQYLNTYADFKAKVIALQDDQGATTCGSGFHANTGFGFSGVIDKESLTTTDPETGDVVPVIRAIDGSVFNGGCVADIPN